MRGMVLAVMLVTAGLAGAQEQMMPGDEAVHLDDVQETADGVSKSAATDAPATLSRKKRGVAPIVGMPCEDGYKQVGDDCVTSNIEFE